MKFLREIPADLIKQRDLSIYEQNGFTLIWKEDSLEIWADTNVDEKDKIALDKVA